MTHTKKKIPYRIKFRGAEYVLADVSPESVYRSKAMRDYNLKRFKPLLTPLDESLGLLGDIGRDLGEAYFRKTGIRDIADLSEEGQLTKQQVFARIATFNKKLADALGNVEIIQKYISAAADIAAQYDLLDPQLFNMNVEKKKQAAKDFRPVAPNNELDKSFRELVNLADARERLNKLDEEEQKG